MEANLVGHMISTSPAQILIASIWQGLLLTGFAWAALKLAPGLRASTRFTLWLIAFLLVALLPFFALPATHSLAGALPQADHSLRLNVAWAFALEVLWAATSLFSLGRLLVAGMQMRTLYRTSTPVLFADLDAEIKSIVVRAGARPIEIRLSDALDAPSVVGFLHPAVIVPSSLWAELEPGDMKQIIMHEKAHLDRGDDWTNLLQKLLRALCPLNPALLWAERHLCMEREQACDDAVLDAAGNPRAYATCLTKLAESRLVKRAAALAPGLWKRHSELAGRVDNILHRKRGLRPAFARALVSTSLVASLLGVVLLQRCPRMITFAAGDPAPVVTAVETAPRIEPRARYQEAKYEEASFHPAEKPVAVKPHAAHKIAPRVRYIAVRGIDENGAMTLVVFTVEAPRSSTAHLLPTPNSWIIFQI
jgi:beta-lactamase regulating signal transducer with metallopeptidase domain